MRSVTIALRHFALGVDPTAAYWDFDLLDGHGGWRAEGCHITGSGGNTTTIHCTHHNNFAVLMVSSPIWDFFFFTHKVSSNRAFYGSNPPGFFFFSPLHHGIVTCFKRHFTQGPFKASFIVALQRRGRICQMRYGDLLALESKRDAKFPL